MTCPPSPSFTFLSSSFLLSFFSFFWSLTATSFSLPFIYVFSSFSLLFRHSLPSSFFFILHRFSHHPRRFTVFVHFLYPLSCARLDPPLLCHLSLRLVLGLASLGS